MSEFVKLGNYGLSAVAEMHAESLRAAGIAAIVQGPQPGMFGAGFSGASVQGVTLLVPADQLAEARELLGEDGGYDAGDDDDHDMGA